MSQTAVERTYFTIPFDDKDDAKALGARFDGTRRLWYAPDDYVRQALTARWVPKPDQGGAEGQPMPQQPWQRSSPRKENYQNEYPTAQGVDGQDRILFEVPFDDNSEVKNLGARFDGNSRKWWVSLSSAAQCVCSIPPLVTDRPPLSARPTRNAIAGMRQTKR